jgi:hypothetical protein
MDDAAYVTPSGTRRKIELLKSVKEALAVDANTGTTFWKDAIEMEMQNVMPAFEHGVICCIASEKLKPSVRPSRHDGVLTKPPEYKKTNLANEPTKSLPGARSWPSPTRLPKQPKGHEVESRRRAYQGATPACADENYYKTLWRRFSSSQEAGGFPLGLRP